MKININLSPAVSLIKQKFSVQEKIEQEDKIILNKDEKTGNIDDINNLRNIAFLTQGISEKKSLQKSIITGTAAGTLITGACAAASYITGSALPAMAAVPLGIAGGIMAGVITARKGTEGKNQTETEGREKSGELKTSLAMDGYMIPQNEGRIKHMCFTFGNMGQEKPAYLNAMKTFISSMDDAKFTILTSDEQGRREVKDEIMKWCNDGTISSPERITVISTGANLSIWAQDSTLVQGSKIMEQDRMDFPQQGDWKVASSLAGVNPELTYERVKGRFIDGGNQLPTMDNIYIGSDAITFMMKDMKNYPQKYNTIKGDLHIDAKDVSHEELCKLMLDRTFPKQKVVIIGNNEGQPAFHIDMAMTPLGKIDPETGKKVVTVGDPSMAIKILKDIKEREPFKYERYERNIENTVTWGPLKPLDNLLYTMDGDRELQEKFDSLAADLEKDGFKVERLPYLGTTKLKYVPWITYNNAVIDGDNIFIPNFGIDELDTAGNSVYEKYGYNTIPVDMNAVSSFRGALNCITKVIEREYTL